MICRHQKIEKHDLGKGISMQVFGIGENLNVLHWDMDDKSEVIHHNHPEEQFGFIIAGELVLTLDDKVYNLKSGDGYFVPSNAWHSFVSVGKTEAIDIFVPIKRKYGDPRIDEILNSVIESQAERARLTSETV